MMWQNRIVGHDNVPPDQLLAHPGNWRVHPKYQQEALRGVINDIGYIKSVTVNKLTGRVVDGHLRVTLALRDGIPTIPVEYVELTEAEEAEALLTLDPIAALAGSDKDNLETLLKRVNTDDAAVMKLLEDTAADAGLDIHGEPKDAEPQIDRAAELLEKWQVKTGDLWQIGEHRLICGDCTDAAVVARVMENKGAMCFTSPPYNAGVSAKLRGNTSIEDNLYKDEYNDDQTEDDYFALLNTFTNNALSVCDYVFVNIQVLAGNKKAFIRYWNNLSDVFCDVAIWRKRQAAPAAAKRVMDSIFEFVLVFGGNGSRAIGTRDFRGMVRNVFEGDAQHSNEFSDMHAATMPVYLPEHFIKTFTNDNELIYEPFAGTGTTLVACQNLGRRGRAIEISPAYCAVTLERMAQAFPGIEIKRL